MIVNNFTVPVFIKKFKQHKNYKQKILDEINSSDLKRRLEENTNNGISVSTDWSINSEIKRPYYDLIEKDLYNHFFDDITSILKCKKINIVNFWFNEYNFINEDFHGWHLHEECMWTNIYYVDLQEKFPKTELKNYMGQIISYNVEEGDILTFPSIVFHRSNITKQNYKKTVISFNCNIGYEYE